jgi:hypothetical protein
MRAVTWTLWFAMFQVLRVLRFAELTRRSEQRHRIVGGHIWLHVMIRAADVASAFPQ